MPKTDSPKAAATGEGRRSGADERGRAGDDEHAGRLEFMLWQVSRILIRVLDEELHPLGLTISQFGMLNRLSVHGPMSNADLARNFGLRPQTVAQVVTVLVRSDLVERRRHPVHKKVLLNELTAQGKQVWEAADQRVEAVESRLRRALGPRHHSAMFQGAQEILEELGAGLDDSPLGTLWPI